MNSRELKKLSQEVRELAERTQAMPTIEEYVHISSIAHKIQYGHIPPEQAEKEMEYYLNDARPIIRYMFIDCLKGEVERHIDSEKYKKEHPDWEDRWIFPSGKPAKTREEEVQEIQQKVVEEQAKEAQRVIETEKEKNRKLEIMMDKVKAEIDAKLKRDKQRPTWL